LALSPPIVAWSRCSRPRSLPAAVWS
jgi:hypothetical protein